MILEGNKLKEKLFSLQMWYETVIILNGTWIRW